MITKTKGFVLSIGILLALSATAGNAFAQKKLRMANWLPPFHHMTTSLAARAEEVKKASGGTLVIDVLKTGLGKPPSQYDLAKNGVVDLSYHVAGYTTGRFTAFRMMEMPFLAPNAEVGSAALWDWYTRNGLDKKEMNDVKLIAAFVHGPGVVHSKNAVKTLEDMNGLKIRVGGGGVEMAKALGAVPVPMSATKAHESLQKGTVTATLFPWESVKGFKLSGLDKYHLEIQGGLYTTSFALVMSPKTWKGLSAKDKAALEKAGGLNGSRFLGKPWDMADVAGRKVAADAGNIISTINPSELKRWAGKISFMEKVWISRVNKKGLDGQKLMADLKATIKKYSN